MIKKKIKQWLKRIRQRRTLKKMDHDLITSVEKPSAEKFVEMDEGSIFKFEDRVTGQVELFIILRTDDYNEYLSSPVAIMVPLQSYLDNKGEIASEDIMVVPIAFFRELFRVSELDNAIRSAQVTSTVRQN